MQCAMRLALLVGLAPAVLAVAPSGGAQGHLRAQQPAKAAAPVVDASSGSPLHLAIQKAADAAQKLAAGRTGKKLQDGCGVAPTYENAKTTDFADGKKTAFNKTSGKQEPLNFVTGDTIEYTCSKGFTTDGSRDGPTTFTAECLELGYYEPGGVCIEASKCGALPNITHASPTGKVVNGKVEFACNMGYSLDGEEVVDGGMGKNRFFDLKCIEFSNSYEEFSGECKAYGFVPATETIRIYNKVTEALFVVSCKGTLKKAFGKGETPAGLDNVCAGFGDQSSACSGLVSTIKSDFTNQLAARDSHDDASEKEWYDADEERPGIDEHANTFCTELWKLLEMPADKK